MNGSVLAASLDAVDYDPITHLNLIFADVSTVGSIRQVSGILREQQDALSRQVAELEARQAYGTESGLERAEAAQAELGQIFGRMERMRARAVQTEQNITSMTADIKRLDGTKRNLTVSMTALKRLQMLATAYEQLRGLAKARQYRDCTGLLQAVLQLMKHFNTYRSIEQIAALSRGVSDLQRELVEQICEDFELAFAKDDVAGRRSILVEAALVIEALGETAKSRLVTWYVNTELREYRQVFRGNDEAGSLENIGRRFSWFKRMLKGHEEQHAALFPAGWRVGGALTTAFCDGTRDDCRNILQRSMRKTDSSKLDVSLLLRCLQETLDFEQGLERRFTSEPRASLDTLSSVDDKAQTFHGAISVAFEPYLSLWLDAQGQQLGQLIPRYRSQPLLAADEEFSAQAVMPSALELFHVYKLMLSQCAKLSTGERLLELARILARYLDEYAQQVLQHFLRQLQQPQQPQQPQSQSQPLGGVQGIVVVLNTADFWHVNAHQLEENIRKRIDGELRARVDLSSQADGFLGVASAAVLGLVRQVEHGCEGAWREMKNSPWAGLDSAGDQSAWVAELVGCVQAKAGEVLGLVVKPHYARSFCDKLVESVAATFVAMLVQCRPISEAGAEQILLDKYVLTKALEGLVSLPGGPGSSTGGHGSAAATASFVKRVQQSMSRLDPVLKTLQVRVWPAEGLVQAYLIHIADRSDSNFRKMLELKGVRKPDQAPLVELFGVHRDGAAAAGLVAASPLLASLNLAGGGPPLLLLPGSGASGSGSGSGLGLASLNATTAAIAGQARLDAAALGEKLLSAAREMGDRAGGVAAASAGIGVGVGGAAAGGGVAGTGGEKPTINDNLKSIGKFFTRDIGALGARFGKRDVSAGSAPDETPR